jgi:ABC-type enterochelin transport system substrate-binding protein
MSNRNIRSKFIVLACAVLLSISASAQDVVHAVSGAITHIDKAGKTIAIKTADGSEEVFRYTDHTAVRDSSKAAARAKMGVTDTYFAGKEGSKVVVRYLGNGADKTATLVEDFGKESLKAGRGTVTHVDKAAHTVTVRTEDGAEATYKMGDQAVVETDHGVVRGSRYIVKEGDKVTIHYTEDAAGKVLRFFKKL